MQAASGLYQSNISGVKSDIKQQRHNDMASFYTGISLVYHITESLNNSEGGLYYNSC